jgi:hypothetical protein
MPHKLVVMKKLEISEGQKVLISHEQGEEVGTVFSINYKTGKAVIYIDEPDCPHFYTTNISQLGFVNHLRLLLGA